MKKGEIMGNKILFLICVLWIAVFITSCDLFDIDKDGISGRRDNCPAVANSDQRDYDGDGRGDACDRDRDGDGIADVDDACISLDPGRYGSCEMLLGVVFDGQSCVYASGCSCEPDCDFIFPDFQSCQNACNDSDPDDRPVCKTPDTDTRKDTSGKECIEYSYKNQTLRINHINAAYNCCPDDIIAQIKIHATLLEIAEDDVLTTPCKCLCLYDVPHKITPLPPAVYTIAISGDNNISTEADLINNPEGIYCEERTGYPWTN